MISWSRRNEIGSDCTQALLRVKDSTPVFSSCSSELAATVTDCQTAQPTPECFICLLVAQCVISGGMSFLFVACRFNPPLLLWDWFSLFSLPSKYTLNSSIFPPKPSRLSLQLNRSYIQYVVLKNANSCFLLCISDYTCNTVSWGEKMFWHLFEFTQLE